MKKRFVKPKPEESIETPDENIDEILANCKWVAVAKPEPFIPTQKFVSQKFDDFVSGYDKFKQSNVIATLEAIGFTMTDLASYYRYEGTYEIAKSLNPKAADFLMGIYKKYKSRFGFDCFSTTIDEVEKFRKCFE